MKVLIVGARGMLGQDLMNVFSEYEPIGVDREEMDVTDPESVFKKMDEVQPDVVINAAGYTAVDVAETADGQQDAIAINGMAVGTLAEICKQHDIPLIHFSTDYVFDGNKADPYKETDTPSPINKYGESKLLGETLLQKNTDKFYLIRTSWLFGKHGKNFVTTMIDLGKQGKQLTIVNDQIGKPTWSCDLAESVLTLLVEKRPYGIYHLVNEEAVSWYDFAVEIFQQTQMEVDVLPVSSEEFVRPAHRPKNSCLANTKFPLLRSHKDALQNYLSTL